MDPTDGSTFRAPQARLLADIHRASAFEAEGHDCKQEAAQAAELVYWLLHPDLKQRRVGKQLSSKVFPWLWARLGRELPECPIDI